LSRVFVDLGEILLNFFITYIIYKVFTHFYYFVLFTFICFPGNASHDVLTLD